MKWSEANRRRLCAECGARVDGDGAWILLRGHSRLVHIPGQCTPLVKGGQGHTDQQIADSTLIGGVSFLLLLLGILVAWLVQAPGCGQ